MDLASEKFYAESREILAGVEDASVLRKGKSQWLLRRAHRVAIRNWLSKYEVLADASGAERARGYLEAYYHLRELGDLRLATRVRRLSLHVKKDAAMQRWQRFEEAGE